jgi:hypothetical protein
MRRSVGDTALSLHVSSVRYLFSLLVIFGSSWQENPDRYSYLEWWSKPEYPCSDVIRPCSHRPGGTYTSGWISKQASLLQKCICFRMCRINISIWFVNVRIWCKKCLWEVGLLMYILYILFHYLRTSILLIPCILYCHMKGWSSTVFWTGYWIYWPL